MKGDDSIHFLIFRHGPVVWAISAMLGLCAGTIAAGLAPPVEGPDGEPVISLFTVIPFVVLLASAALMPLISRRIWHRHYPDFAFGLGGIVAGYYMVGMGMYGMHAIMHAGLEYYAFIALVGGLYVVSGGILIRTQGRAGPVGNTLLLAFGAVLANIVGTTGASVLLIRPFMRLNEGRLRPLHIILFIFIVSNCGGSLTPIGDPPLYLGFLKGVPFFWTLKHLWEDWLITVGPLLVVYFAIDTFFSSRDRKSAAPAAEKLPFSISILGMRGIIALVLMIGGVFVDPLLGHFGLLQGLPVGATFQLLVAIVAYTTAPRQLLEENEFTFEPVKDVGLLFVGIFITMVPALGYLSAHGGDLGLDSPTRYYWATGGLSAILDNAPTYLNFLQISIAPEEVTRASIATFIATPLGSGDLRAISTAAVFFGAMTYIGNGPNFMVKAIAESSGVRMPTFLGYLGWASLILLPILAIHWYVMIR